MNLTAIGRYLQDRLMEPSSIRGLIWLAAGSGILGKGAASDITTSEAMIALAAIIAGLVGLLTKDAKHIVINADTVLQADNVGMVTTASHVDRADVVLDSEVTTVVKGNQS